MNIKNTLVKRRRRKFRYIIFCKIKFTMKKFKLSVILFIIVYCSLYTKPIFIMYFCCDINISIIYIIFVPYFPAMIFYARPLFVN